LRRDGPAFRQALESRRKLHRTGIARFQFRVYHDSRGKSKRSGSRLAVTGEAAGSDARPHCFANRYARPRMNVESGAEPRDS